MAPKPSTQSPGRGGSATLPPATGDVSAGAHSADAADWSRRSAEGAEADERAREIEQQMTDDERFSLVISLIGPVPSIKNQNQLLGRLC